MSHWFLLSATPKCISKFYMFLPKRILPEHLKAGYFTVCKLNHNILNSLNLRVFFFFLCLKYFVHTWFNSFSFLLIWFHLYLKISSSWKAILIQARPISLCRCISCLGVSTCLWNLFLKVSVFTKNKTKQKTNQKNKKNPTFLKDHRNLVMALNTWN